MTFKKTTLIFKKIVLVMMVFVFVVQPLAPALAVEQDTSAPPADASAPASESASQDTLSPDNSTESASSETSAAPAAPTDDTQSSSPEAPQTEQEGSSSESDDPQSMASSSGDIMGPAPAYNGPLSNKLPEIDKNTGALNYQYAIAVPPGRNNLQPSLALSYNSNSNDASSIFGHGWSLGILYIQRLNKAGVDKLYNAGTAS